MKLKDWLVTNKISISAFASILGVARSYLSQIVNDKRNPSNKLKDKIKKYSDNEVTFNLHSQG